MASDELSFDFTPDVTNNVTNPIKIPIESATKWHAIELSYKNGEIKFTVDYRRSQSKMFGLSLNIGHKVIIGSSLKSEYTKCLSRIDAIYYTIYLFVQTGSPV